MGIRFDAGGAAELVGEEAFRAELDRAAAIGSRLLERSAPDEHSTGWLDCAPAAGLLDTIKAKAAGIRAGADVFVLVGVGGSNQAARAVVEALAPDASPRIRYAGNTLAPDYLVRLLEGLEGKRVHLNVVAKNFETLEPGVHYRALRNFLEKAWSPAELAGRIALTGSRGGLLEKIAAERGHLFLEFPADVGGRYSAFTAVGLLPLAAAGLDLDAYLRGGADMARRLAVLDGDNPALGYAALRNLLYRRGFLVEQLAVFEPRLECFNRWWRQLFGESEGKDGRGIFPASAVYTEDLHSIGQYLQEGRRMLMETFLSVEDPGASLPIEPDPVLDDRFGYLDGKDFADLNRAAEEATRRAHASGGVPCLGVAAGRLDEYHFGQLFYFFMFACAVSGKLLGVDPFDQGGVENYKSSMFAALGKPGSVRGA